MRIFESILNHLSSKKAYKTISWLILVIFILIIILYPIIDANFLYYKRVNNRIEILKEISSIDIASLGSNPVLAEEYNAIISEVSLAKEHYINNIFIIETGFWKNFVKVISASWIFIIFAIAMFFVRNDSEKNIILVEEFYV